MYISYFTMIVGYCVLSYIAIFLLIAWDYEGSSETKEISFIMFLISPITLIIFVGVLLVIGGGKGFWVCAEKLSERLNKIEIKVKEE